MYIPSAYHSAITKQSRWFLESSSQAESVPALWQPWLQHRGSLTSALIQFGKGDFAVRVLGEYWKPPLAHEAAKLGIAPHLAARIREVELLCGGEVMVFARSIIPLSMYHREPHTFKGMGSKPLGHLLFRDGRARFRQRSFCVYQASDKLPIFGRATPYEYHGGEILVSEFFVNDSLLQSRPP